MAWWDLIVLVGTMIIFGTAMINIALYGLRPSLSVNHPVLTLETYERFLAARTNRSET